MLEKKSSVLLLSFFVVLYVLVSFLSSLHPYKCCYYFTFSVPWRGGVALVAQREFSLTSLSPSLSHSHRILPVFTKQKKEALYLIPLILCFYARTCLFLLLTCICIVPFFSESFSSTEYIIGRFFIYKICSVEIIIRKKNYIVHIRSILDALSGRAVVLVTVFEVGRPLLKNSKQRRIYIHIN